MGFPYWGDGSPLYISAVGTGSLLYWGDGLPVAIITLPAAGSIIPTGIASCEAFGTVALEIDQFIYPSGIALPTDGSPGAGLGRPWTTPTDPGSYVTPNVPDLDPTCVACWHFEPQDNFNDYIGNNSLTARPSGPPNEPTFSQTAYKSGSAALILHKANAQYLSRADADLNSDFPLKNGNSLCGTISSWFYFTDAATMLQPIWTKWSDAIGLKSIKAEIGQGFVQIEWGNGGSIGALWQIKSLTANSWYHLTVNFDGPNKTVAIRLWDDTAQTAYLAEHTFAFAMGGCDADFSIGASGKYPSVDADFFDGYIDEIIVWERKLTIAEMELTGESVFHGSVKVEDNIFTSDPSVQAIWNFELADPTADSSGNGNNIITDNLTESIGLVGSGTAGKYSTGYGVSSGAYIPDANLANGFPFKSNDTLKQITLCAWITPYTWMSLSGGYIYSQRRRLTNNGFDIFMDTASPYHLKINWGDGTALTVYDTGIVLSNLKTYHISVEIDGLNKIIYVEVFDNTTGDVYTYSEAPATQIVVGTCGVGIGNIALGEEVDCFNGYLDQYVVWDRLLLPSELNKVRGGNFILASNVLPFGIAYSGGVGNPNIVYNQTVSVNNISSQAALGAPAVIRILTALPTGIVSGEAIGSPGILADQAILPSGIASQEGCGTPGVSPDQTVQAESITSQGALGSPVVIRNDCILPSGIASQGALGTAEITTGPVVLSPSGIGSSENFGTAKLPLNVKPTAIGSRESLGTLELIPGPVAIRPDPQPSQEALGLPAVIPGPVDILPAAIASEEGEGAPKIVLFIRPTDITSEENFGNAQLNLEVRPISIESEEGVGEPVRGGWVRIDGGDSIPFHSGIESAEVFGNSQLNLVLKPDGVASEAAFGALEAIPGPVWIYPFEIESYKIFGQALVIPKSLAGLIILEDRSVRTIEFDDGQEEIVLHDNSPLRMVVNG